MESPTRGIPLDFFNEFNFNTLLNDFQQNDVDEKLQKFYRKLFPDDQLLLGYDAFMHGPIMKFSDRVYSQLPNECKRNLHILSWNEADYSVCLVYILVRYLYNIVEENAQKFRKNIEQDIRAFFGGAWVNFSRAIAKVPDKKVPLMLWHDAFFNLSFDIPCALIWMIENEKMDLLLDQALRCYQLIGLIYQRDFIEFQEWHETWNNNVYERLVNMKFDDDIVEKPKSMYALWKMIKKQQAKQTDMPILGGASTTNAAAQLLMPQSLISPNAFHMIPTYSNQPSLVSYSRESMSSTIRIPPFPSPTSINDDVRWPDHADVQMEIHPDTNVLAATPPTSPCSPTNKRKNTRRAKNTPAPKKPKLMGTKKSHHRSPLSWEAINTPQKCTWFLDNFVQVDTECYFQDSLRSHLDPYFDEMPRDQTYDNYVKLVTSQNGNSSNLVFWNSRPYNDLDYTPCYQFNWSSSICTNPYSFSCAGCECPIQVLMCYDQAVRIRTTMPDRTHNEKCVKKLHEVLRHDFCHTTKLTLQEICPTSSQTQAKAVMKKAKAQIDTWLKETRDFLEDQGIEASIEELYRTTADDQTLRRMARDFKAGKKKSPKNKKNAQADDDEGEKTSFRVRMEEWILHD